MHFDCVFLRRSRESLIGSYLFHELCHVKSCDSIIVTGDENAIEDDIRIADDFDHFEPFFDVVD